MRDVVVIANCQSLCFAEAIALGTRGLRTEYIDVNFLGRPGMQETAKAEALLADTRPETLVFSFNLSDNFGLVATRTLRERMGNRLRTFTNLYFAGLHPDLTYFGNMGGRLVGAFGDYHSKLVITAYANGLSAADCRALFKGHTYEKIGYFDIWAASEAELLQRDAACDIKVAPEFLGMIREAPNLYTVNHPTARVFEVIGSRLCEAEWIEFHADGQFMGANRLSDNYVWPVLDELAEHHGLSWRAPQRFFVARRGGHSRAMTFEDFIAASYASYGMIPDQVALVATMKSMPYHAKIAAALSLG